MKLICKTSLILLFFYVGILQTQLVEAQKSDLKILYVGETAEAIEKTPSYVSSDDAKRQVELKKERPEAFKKLLEEYFKTVKIIVSDDYKIGMSADFDVTIFDAKPPVSKSLPQPGGWEKKIRLPDDFSHSAMMIGEVGPFTIGRFGNDFLIDHL